MFFLPLIQFRAALRTEFDSRLHGVKMHQIWNKIQLHPDGTIVGDESTPRGAYALKLLQTHRPDEYLNQSNNIDNEIATQLNEYLIKKKSVHPFVIQRPNFDINRDYQPVIVNHPYYGKRYFSTLNGKFIRDNQAQRGYSALNYDNNGNVIEVNGSKLNEPYIKKLELGEYFTPTQAPQPTGTIMKINSDGSTDGFIPPVKEYNLGGRTSRLFASGGAMDEQIPMGEQPDYNMVGAGGSHEMNPQGGVPYGMNQDGTQNMVEQGEVSVGNNVFSDRTAISPELCQQLGLPEGISPAQAMQQIEALYKQGQIGDEEFQEIQQIIFDDQEAQKQNVGGSYQQGQVGGEGITPDMIQGQNMPPQAMPQQGAPEGIAPEMVQGGAYAFGGRRRC